MKKSSVLAIKKFLILLILATAASGFAYYMLTGSDETSERPRRRASAVGVEVAPVERRDLVEKRVFIGTLEAEKQFDAAFKVGGRIQEITVNLGDCINKGSLIARLDSEEFEQQLAQAQAELDVALASLTKARSNLVAAERNYERATKLREQKVSPAAELEASETEMLSQRAGVNLALAQVKQREAALRAAEVRLSYTVLVADWQSGDTDVCRYVARKPVDEGDTISANTSVVTLVDLSQLKAVINVAERDYVLLNIDQPAEIEVDSIADQVFPGTIVRMAPVFDDSSRQARIEIGVANPDSILKSGMFARVQIELGRADQAVAAPLNAIIQRMGDYGVFAVENGTARFIKVRPGIQAEGWTQVTGLEEGQQVVTLGHHLLSDGTPVSLNNGKQEGPPTTGGRQ